MIASQTTECSCKHIVSVSLGSSERNAKSTLQLKGQTFIIERLGTDGNLQKARQLLEELDGRVDALGLGGTDLYVYAGGRRYTFRESAKLIENVKNTPVLDGSGLKNSLERILINRLAADKIIDFQGKISGSPLQLPKKAPQAAMSLHRSSPAFPPSLRANLPVYVVSHG